MSFTESDFSINTHELIDIILVLCYNRHELDNDFNQIIQSISDNPIMIHTNQNITIGLHPNSLELVIVYGPRIIFDTGDWHENPNEKVQLLTMLLIDKFTVESNRITSQHLEEIVNLEENQNLEKIQKSENSVEKLSNAYMETTEKKVGAAFMTLLTFMFATFFAVGSGLPILYSLFVLPIFYYKRIRECNVIIEQLTEACSEENDQQLLALKGIVPDED